MPGTNAPQTLLHQRAINLVQRHHIRHRPQRHQIQQVRQRRLAGFITFVSQGSTQRQQQIKRHAHASQIVARAICLQARIDDGIRRR